MRPPARFVVLLLGWLLLLVPMVVSICDEFQLMALAALGNITEIGLPTENLFENGMRNLGSVEGNREGQRKPSGNMIGESKRMNEGSQDWSEDRPPG